jgi:hypothetical protein
MNSVSLSNSSRIRPFAALSASHRQAFLAVQALGLLAVDDHAVTPQQDVQAAIAKPAALMRQLAQLLANVSIIRPPRAIAHTRPISADHPTPLRSLSNDASHRRNLGLLRPPFAHPMHCPEMNNRVALDDGRYHFFDSRSFRPALSSIASARSRFSRPFSSSRAFCV